MEWIESTKEEDKFHYPMQMWNLKLCLRGFAWRELDLIYLGYIT